MYSELYEAWRREVTDSSLGALPPDFYAKIAAYLKRIKEENRPDQKSIKLNLLVREAQNVDTMLQELLSLRYRKIIKATTKTQRVPTELLTTEEAKMTESFVGFAETYQKFSQNLLQGETTKIAAPEPIKVVIRTENPPTTTTPPQTQASLVGPQAHVTHKRLTLRFTKAIPAIMGADMKSYGPFQPEDVASLPELNAKILVKQGLAVLVEIS
jgi:DNA replication initiation complex subunit (GINS family)